jgi:hypothetical protein
LSEEGYISLVKSGSNYRREYEGVATLYTRLTTPALAGVVREDGVDAWLDKEKNLNGLYN